MAVNCAWGGWGLGDALDWAARQIFATNGWPYLRSTLRLCLCGRGDGARLLGVQYCDRAYLFHTVFLHRNVKLAFLFYGIPSSRVPKMPGSRERRNVNPGTRAHLCFLVVSPVKSGLQKNNWYIRVCLFPSAWVFWPKNKPCRHNIWNIFLFIVDMTVLTCIPIFS